MTPSIFSPLNTDHHGAGHKVLTSACSRRGLLIGAGVSLLAGGTSAEPERDLIEPRMTLKTRTRTGRTVALTLDACPGGFDRRIADVLVEKAIPATIMVTGSWIRRHPDDVAFLKAYPHLFALENHGDRHIAPVLGDRRVFGVRAAGDLAGVEREVWNGAYEVQALTGSEPRWYRAATGFYSRPALAAIESWGLGIAAYSLNADQGASLPAEAVAQRLTRAADGEVIVAHINQPGRPSGLGVAEGVRTLRERGVRFVRLDHLAFSDVSYAS